MLSGKVTVSEFVEIRRARDFSAIMVAGMENCGPCDLLEGALEDIEKALGLPVVKCIARLSEKRDFGELAKAGITQFPSIEVYVEGERMFQAHGVREKTSPAVAENVITRWFRSQTEQESMTVS